MNLKIGAAIRELRTKNGITQEKLAAHLGVSIQAVSRWESETCLRTFLHELFFHFFVAAKDLLLLPHLSDEEKTSAAENLLQILDLVTDGSYGEFELYLDTIYEILYQCTGDGRYFREADYHEKRYEALPENFTYSKGFFRGCTFDHKYAVRSISGSAG